MHRYLVIDTNLEDRSIALRDDAGHYHVARSSGEMPMVENLLEGPPPHLGSALLVGRGGRVMPVIFDLVDTGQVDVFERLHASLTP
jgi:hypothetical protein